MVAMKRQKKFQLFIMTKKKNIKKQNHQLREIVIRTCIQHISAFQEKSSRILNYLKTKL